MALTWNQISMTYDYNGVIYIYICLGKRLYVGESLRPEARGPWLRQFSLLFYSVLRPGALAEATFAAMFAVLCGLVYCCVVCIY